jgi:hypothetical protein
MTQPVQIIELRQKRCSLRFGVGACGATGSPKCFQTENTCRFKAAYNRDGRMSWFFHRAGDPEPDTAALPGANDWRGPSVPVLQSVSTEESRINLGAIREGESPFGMRGTINVTLADFLFSNEFGDFYAGERTIRASFAALFLAWIGEAASQIELYWYQGVKGQSLDEMTQRRFDVINIDGPNEGRWSISGFDPLHRALRTKALFPRATDLRLVSDVLEDGGAITVFGELADVVDGFGNTTEKYARLGSEIISYTGHTGSAGVWTLQGVVRGALLTTPARHSVNSGVQRVGHFNRWQYWRIVHYLLTQHTTIDPAMIPFDTVWMAEGQTYLNTLFGTGTFIDPRPVEEVCGQAMRDGMFSLWWDAVAQQIPIKALRQPRGVLPILNEAEHLTQTAIVRVPDDRITRFVTYYGRGVPTRQLNEVTNYDKVRIRLNAQTEGPDFADGTVRARIVYSPLMRTDANAILTQAMQLQRYEKTPKYLSFRVSRKDAGLAIGDVVGVETHAALDTLGNPIVQFWEIIQGPKEVDPGAVYEYMAQSVVLFDRPGFIMANDAPDFASATDAQKVNACYISGNDGLMTDGSPAYVIQ